MPYTYPIGADETACVLVPIRISFVPFVAGALRQLEARENWQSEADHEAAYNAIAEIEAAMVNDCLEQLIASNERIYRLLDTAINGTVYTAIGEGETRQIIPAIPETPTASDGITPSIMYRLRHIHQAIDNGINGREYPDYQSSVAMRNQLADILAAIEAGGGLDDEMLQKLTTIAGLLA